MRRLLESIGHISLFLMVAACVTPPKNTLAPEPIELVSIQSAGDSFGMGDGSTGLSAIQTFSYSFMISKHEITWAQFMGFYEDGGYNNDKYWTANGWSYRASAGAEWTRPFHMADKAFAADNHPANQISWYEAVAFCNWLSGRQGLTPAYEATGRIKNGANGYRLPTETEWEYSAAKGEKRVPERIYPWGDSWNIGKVVGNTETTALVGSKSLLGGDTPLGIADLGGNVVEWCSDNWQEDGSVIGTMDRYFFENDSPEQFFMQRGGAYVSPSEDFFRCASRGWLHPYDRGSPMGFRVARR